MSEWNPERRDLQSFLELPGYHPWSSSTPELSNVKNQSQELQSEDVGPLFFSVIKAEVSYKFASIFI
jgi:hypothetical protein